MHHSGPHLYRTAGTATQGQGSSGPGEGKEHELSAIVPTPDSFFFLRYLEKIVEIVCPSAHLSIPGSTTDMREGK